MGELDLLYEELERDEGVKLTMYLDPLGIPTIGVGHNLKRPISARASRVILEDDVEEHRKAVLQALPWADNLSPVRFRALLNMAFNLGVPGLLKFHNFLGALQKGDYINAAKFMLESLWARQVGARAIRLSEMILHG